MDSQLVTSSDSGYAKRRKQHLALINQLRAMGAQADLDLPRIAVIGNQSAGKSSLVEAISGIKVPRDAGTCTRCPFECRLSSSSDDTWTCQISIRWEFETNGKRRYEGVQEIPFGPLITHKEDVELVLRRAQANILNPDVSPDTFLHMPAEELRSRYSNQKGNELPFSRNCVCLDISGPDLTDLSFVDLPGIIQNAEDSLVRFVEELVLSHIKGNCIILVTLPMSDDIENQKAVRLAKQVDPSGHRTIGVITKPDTLTTGATKMRDLWLDVIEGRRHPLTHGYYCTRQPDDDERTRGITSHEARNAETTFFAQTSPWSTSSHAHRFGTKNLVESLSTLLTGVIDESLPKLVSEAKQRHASCMMELQSLPEPITSEPTTYILNLVTMFCSTLKLYVQGESRSVALAALVQGNRRTYSAFKRDIRGSAPKFLPFLSAKESQGDMKRGDQDEFLNLDENEDEEGLALEQSATLSQSNDGYLYLQDVRKHIQRSLTRELPSNVPYNAKLALIEEFQKNWERDTRKCFNQVHSSLQNVVSNLIHVSIGRHKILESRFRLIVDEEIQHQQSSALLQVLKLLRFEKKTPFTQNGHYFSATKDKYMSKYKDARARSPSPIPKTKADSGTNDNAAVSPLPASPLPASQSTVANPFGGFFSNKPLAKENDFTFGMSLSGATGVSPFGTRSQKSDPPPPPKPSQPRSVEALKPAPAVPQPSTPLLPVSPGASFVPIWEKVKPVNELGVEAGGQAPLTEDERRKEEANVIGALAKLGYLGIIPEDFGKMRPADEYEEEMEVMAEVRAYFQVAYKRLIDYIPMTIDNEFLFAFSDHLQEVLIQKLGLGSTDATTKCMSYIAEDSKMSAHREELTSRKKRLQGILAELASFGM